MDGGGRRQLPSWMIRASATEQASISETKEDVSVKPHTKAVEPHKKTEAKKHDSGVPLTEDKLNLLKKCETRSRKRKLNKHDVDQGERIQEDESCLLKPCKESRSKRISTKHGEDRVDDFLESDTEKNVHGIISIKARGDAPRKKHLKILMKELQSGTSEPSPSEDELTVEDLVTIAKEYLKADRMNEFQHSKKVEFEPETKSQLRADSEIGSKKNLPLDTKNNLVTDEPLSSNSSMIKPLSSEGSFSNLSTTRDPSLDMLDLLLGPWLKKAEEVERKTDTLTEKITLDYELSKRSQNDTVAEVAPVTKKKFSLKDRVGRLLD